MDDDFGPIGEEHIAVIAPCFACKQPFMFDPDTVVSIPIDPVTGLPPDMGGDPQRAVRQPVDPGCLALAAAGRKAAGLPPHEIIRPAV